MIEVTKLGNVALDTPGVPANLGNRCIEFFLATPRHENVSAFRRKESSRVKLPSLPVEPRESAKPPHESLSHSAPMLRFSISMKMASV